MEYLDGATYDRLVRLLEQRRVETVRLTRAKVRIRGRNDLSLSDKLAILAVHKDELTHLNAAIDTIMGVAA